MTGRRFGAPDWGQDHLSLDAVVAYVDDELSAGPHHRAETHLACCSDCRAEVVAQRQARAALRGASCPRLPSSLMHTLRAIPVEAELPPPPPGLGITADGQFVLLRDVPEAPCPGAGSRRPSRRARFGAVSGLALGALAVGALAAPTGPLEQGVLGGTVLNGTVVNGLSGTVLHGSVSQASARASTPAAVPAVVGPTRDADGTDAATPDATVSDATAPDATASDATASDATASDATVSDDSGSDSGSDGSAWGDSGSDDPGSDGSAVLDPRVRQRLDRAPVAFYRSP